MTKHNFHCKPYKQKTKGEFKVLKFDLKRVGIGSKPYMRIYGNHKLPPTPREKPIRSKTRTRTKNTGINARNDATTNTTTTTTTTTTTATPAVDHDQKKAVVKKEKSHDGVDDLLHSSHNWLMAVTRRDDGLANFVRPDLNEDGVGGTKRRNENGGVFTNIPPGEYFLKKKNRVKRHKTC